MQLDLERRPNTATFSPDGLFRYTLTRELGGDRPLVAMGLNPSTATAELDDPTIRRDVDFARRWECDRVIKVNAFGYRATKPKDMFAVARSGVDIVGPGNDDAIRWALGLALLNGGILMVAWGSHITPERQAEVARAIRFSGVTPMCLAVNNNGTPKHELYVAGYTQLRPWVCP